MGELINTNDLSSLIPMSTNGKGVNARDLHAFLGSKKDFSNWIKDRIKKCGYQQGIDFQTICFDYRGNIIDVKADNLTSENQYVSKIDYIITIEMAKELCMMERSEIGCRMRRYFIGCESMNRTLLEQKTREQQKQIESITVNNMELHNQITAQQPAVIFAESVASSNDAIRMDDLAKLITQSGYIINRNELFAWLVKNGYLLRRQRKIGRKLVNDYSPSQEGVRLHLFHLHAEHIKGLNCMRYTCKVTGKGQIYFVNKFKEIVNGKTKG